MITDSGAVSTAAARYQQLSLNPLKLAGQCGKLKCCLNYELDAYRSALKIFPKPEVKLQTEKGVAVLQKMDIFKEQLWYAYKGQWMNWHMLSLESVNEIIVKNNNKEKVPSLEEYENESIISKVEKTDLAFENVVGQDSLNRFDRSKKSNNKTRKKRKPNRRQNND